MDRRRLLKMAENLPSGWKLMTIHVAEDSGGADALLALLQTIPECEYAVCALDDQATKYDTNNRFVAACWAGSTTGSYYERYRDGHHNMVSAFSASYDCQLRAGDEIIVLYLEKMSE